MRSITLMLGLGLAAQVHCALADTTAIHVSTQGNDSSSGTLDQPVRSIHRATELARESRLAAPENSLEILIHQGEYQLTKPLLLTEQDSGSEDAPITYKSYDSDQVVLSGAKMPVRIGMASDWPEYQSFLSSEAARQVAVYEAPVDEDAWIVSAHGESLGIQPSSLQLFADGEFLPQSRFPNQGWSQLKANFNFADVLNRISDDRNSWIHGFPANDYQDEFLPLRDGIMLDWHVNSRFRIINSLPELDQPGEWYLDSINQRILWWPTLDDEYLRVSNMETLVSLYDVQHVRFEGLTFEGARVQAIEIAGGYDCIVSNCDVRCIGNVGINVFHGEKHRLVNCQLHSTGSSAIRLEGGNRQGRVAANHVCQGQQIHNCNTQFLARHAAIAVYGVGMTIEDNTIYQQPDHAISLWGDENIVRSNHIYSVCQETSDSGAIYLADNSGYQNNVITKNHIHHLDGLNHGNVYGIYLDNQAGRNRVTTNFIHHVPRAIVVRGGSENNLDRNVIHNCWIGLQFQWSEDSKGNQVSSNIVDSQNSLLVSHAKPEAILTYNNLGSVAELFIDALAGDLRFTDKSLALELGLEIGLYAGVPDINSDQQPEAELAIAE